MTLRWTYAALFVKRVGTSVERSRLFTFIRSFGYAQRVAKSEIFLDFLAVVSSVVSVTSVDFTSF